MLLPIDAVEAGPYIPIKRRLFTPVTASHDPEPTIVCHCCVKGARPPWRLKSYFGPIDAVFGRPDIAQRRLITFIPRVPCPSQQPQTFGVNDKRSATPRLPARIGRV